MSVNDHRSVLPAFPFGPPFDCIRAGFTTKNIDQVGEAGLQALPEVNNRSLIRVVACDWAGVEAATFTSGVQIHEENVVRVTTSEKGKGAFAYEEGIPRTDGLITDLRRVPLGVYTADCVPVFLYDPARPAVGVVHAGWRSTVRSIVERAVGMMAAEFGSDPNAIHAAIGPSIGQCCYEVGRDVFDEFHSAFGYADSLFKKTGRDKWHLDLWEANLRQLLTCGIRGDYIFTHRICSYCNSHEFSSARKHGTRAGRTLSFIAIL